METKIAYKCPSCSRWFKRTILPCGVLDLDDKCNHEGEVEVVITLVTETK